MSPAHRENREALAIVGIGCRLPGGVDSPADFWRLLLDEVDATREVPESRWHAPRFHDPTAGKAGKMVTRRGGYLEEIEKKPEFKSMSKKELASLNRDRIKLERNLRGVRGMEKYPDAVIIVDSAREHIAVNESRRLRIPIVALVDTNADPDIIDYPIAANDDAIRSIRIILQKLIDPVIAAAGEKK